MQIDPELISKVQNGVLTGLLVAIGSIIFTYIFNQILKTEPICYYNPFVKYQNYKKIKHVDTRLDDIVGCEEIKEDVRKMLCELKNRKNKVRSKGFIFYGPPGTGKTMMAKGLANEINVPFFSIANKYAYTGGGMSVVQTIKGIIYRNSPCVIIMDEGFQFLKHSTHDFLELLDGLENTKNVIFIVTLTEKEFAELPEPITRSGRIDRIIKFNYPNKSELRALVKKYIRLDPADIDMMCDQLPYNVTHSDIVSLKERLDIDRPSNVYEYVTKNITAIIGAKEINTIVYNKANEERVCYHEVGHLVVSLMLKSSQKPNNVSILNKGEYAGCTSMNRTNIMFTLTELISMACVYLAGSLCEKRYTGDLSTGIVHDIEKIEKLVDMILKSRLVFLEMLHSRDQSQHSHISVFTPVDDSVLRSVILHSLLQYSNNVVNKILDDSSETVAKLHEALMSKKNLTIKEINKLVDTNMYDSHQICVDDLINLIKTSLELITKQKCTEHNRSNSVIVNSEEHKNRTDMSIS
ncbi:ATP-dependent metallopeptidase FtsH/Yme1/Tma family protein [Yasminevirus sp. GU-2018]|uniref:ATP-dependent metallopeptidase FtsH/Yme1/Tma family protein n=1 Tax=Yasminevirus sp. GU-2018 TaxID=2420051 RepID=A0A5K0U959_9VIRU|nr:ATP-dependent metallopeptidase FtsH/Yme1/Tma family protein [Yasminevirus sp. GU-2018]